MKKLIKTCLYWAYSTLRWLMLIPALLFVLLAMAAEAIGNIMAKLADLSVLPRIKKPRKPEASR